MPGTELVLNQNVKLLEIVVDNETIWPDISIDNNRTTMQEEFDKNKIDFKCDKCHKIFPEPPLPYENVTQQSHFLSCVICTNQFASVVEIYKHYMLCHPNEANPLLIKNEPFCECKLGQGQS